MLSTRHATLETMYTSYDWKSGTINKTSQISGIIIRGTARKAKYLLLLIALGAVEYRQNRNVPLVFV
jgi:hypothetical protein